MAKCAAITLAGAVCIEAKKVFFEAFLEAGVSVVTLRPQKRTSVLETQAALILEWSG